MKPKRRKTKKVLVGSLAVGGDAPVSIQSMTKANAVDEKATLVEIRRLKREGCQLVRMAVPTEASLAVMRKIVPRVDIPLMADIHFNWKLALGAIEAGFDGIRLNPGNIYRKKEVAAIARAAMAKNIPVRIGVNSGSLRKRPVSEKELPGIMVQSALDYIKYLEDLGLRDIIISLKASDVLSTIIAYRKMAAVCKYPLHIGVTATGGADIGIVKSAIGIGSLLAEGIGDTLRVSLTAPSWKEVRIGKAVLTSVGLYCFRPDIISCPTCGRCQINLPRLVQKAGRTLRVLYKGNPQAPALKIAVMGCMVNGPGEARDADLGIAGGKGTGIIFKKGRILRKVKEKDLVKELSKEAKNCHPLPWREREG